MRGVVADIGAVVPAAVALGVGGRGDDDGFGGFLDRSFREHDYQLGRRNCQRLLSSWLTEADLDLLLIQILQRHLIVQMVGNSRRKKKIKPTVIV